MPDWGCIHLRCEWIMSTGMNTQPPKEFTDRHERCGSKCYVCTGRHRDYMMPIIVTGAMSFLSTDVFRRALDSSNLIIPDNSNELIKTLTDNADHRKMVFGLKFVKAYSVNAFFFQLFATNILSCEWQNNTTGLCFALTKDQNNNCRYKTLNSWKGFEFRSRYRGGTPMSHASLASQPSIRDYLSQR